MNNQALELIENSLSPLGEDSFFGICAVIPLDGNNLSYVPVSFSPKIQRKALIDTGACANAIPSELFEKLKLEESISIKYHDKTEFEYVRLASGKRTKIITQITVKFHISDHQFEDSFLVLPNMNSILLGNPFFKKHEIDICPKDNLLKLPDLTLQLNEIRSPRGQPKKVEVPTKYPILASCKKTIQPHCQDFLECVIGDAPQSLLQTTGIVIPNEEFEKKTGLKIMSSISTIDNKYCIKICLLNTDDTPVTFKNNTHVANFKILTPLQASTLNQLDPQLISSAKFRNENNFCAELNQLISHHRHSRDKQPERPKPDYSRLWFPTPETCTDASKLSPLHRRIHDAIADLQNQERLDPKNNETDRATFLARFDWKDSILTEIQQTDVESLLIEFSDIFAKHRFDVGYNTEYKVKLTPEHKLPVYTQSPPTMIHLRDELLIELALMQYFDLLTTLDNSKYCSPIFTQRKSNGRLRILIDLRRINHLLRHDYKNSNFPISNMSDAVNHFAGKKYFCKLDCSQAYHCVSMADDLSVQLLAFNFSSRTYAYKRLAQGLNKSVTGFSSFVRHYLDHCLAADLCAQFMDDIGCGVEKFEDLIPNLRQVFTAIRRSGLRLSPEKCHFGTSQIKFLGNVITTSGLTPETEKIERFLKTLRMPVTIKQVKRLIGFFQFFRNFIPNLNGKLIPFYRLLRKNLDFIITEEHKTSLTLLRSDLRKATETTLRLAKPDKQYVILTDASYHQAGYVLMIEDYLQPSNDMKTTRTYAPVSFGSRLFNAAQAKLSIYCKEFLALYFALEQFAHFIWGATKPVLILTDNKSLTQFFQAKTIPPSLWNFIDRVVSFNIVVGHIPGTANAAADFLSRMETNPNETIDLQLTDRIPVREIEISMSAKAPDVSLNSLLTSADTDQANSTLSRTLLDAIEQSVDAETLLPLARQIFGSRGNTEVTECLKFVKIDQINALLSSNPQDNRPAVFLEDPANVAAEQMKDSNLRIVKQWLENGDIPDETYTNFELRKYRKQFRRLICENSVIYRLFYDDCGRVKHKQICVPSHLRAQILYEIHNSQTGGHLGITKTAHEFRQRFYFPGFSEFLICHIRNCLTCLQLKRAPTKSITPPLQELSSLQSFPGDILQIDIVGPFQSPFFRYVLTGIDVFTKYLFGVPLTSPSAKSVASSLVNIFFRHSYMPETIMADLGTAFTSRLFHELTSLLEVRVKHATLKHPQSIGVVERAHAALKRILKLNTDQQWNDWYKYVDLACFIHNTSYHASIGCTPSLLFHGREPLKPLDLKFKNSNLKRISPTFDYVRELQDAVVAKFQDTKQNLVNSYHRYRSYFDRKAAAHPLKLNSYCLLLNPILTTQSEFASKSAQIWLPLYRVEKVLTSSNYLIRKVGSNYTQIVHRLRLKPFIPQQTPDDIENVNERAFIPDPSLSKFRGEPTLFDAELPHVDDQPNPFIGHDMAEPSSPDVGVVWSFSAPIGPPVPAASPAEAVESLPTASDSSESDPKFPDPFDAPGSPDSAAFIVESHRVDNPRDLSPTPDVIDVPDGKVLDIPSSLPRPTTEANPPSRIPVPLTKSRSSALRDALAQASRTQTSIYGDYHRQFHSQPQTSASESSALDRPTRYQLRNKVMTQTVTDRSGRTERQVIPTPYRDSTNSSTKKGTKFPFLNNLESGPSHVQNPSLIFAVPLTLQFDFSLTRFLQDQKADFFDFPSPLKLGQVIPFYDQNFHRWIYFLITRTHIEQNTISYTLRLCLQKVLEHALLNLVHSIVVPTYNDHFTGIPIPSISSHFDSVFENTPILISFRNIS